MRASNQSQSISTQTGIRQRSLRKHCRLGRATELVFVMATGAMLVLSGGMKAAGAEAQPEPVPMPTAVTILDGGSIIDVGAINNLAGGTLTFAGDATVNADSDNVGDEIVTNAGTFIVNDTSGSTVAVDGDAFTNSGTGTIAVNGTATLNGITILTNASNSATAINIATGATLSATTLNSSVGTITVAGTLEAATTITGGTLNVLTNGDVGAVQVTSNGILDVAGGTVASLDLDAGTTQKISDAGEVTGTTTIDNATLTQSGVSSKLGTDGTDASTVTVGSGGVYVANNGIAGDVTNNGGTITAAGTNFASLDNKSGGTVTIKDSKTLEAGSLRNDGNLILEANATFEGTGNTFNNDGTTTVADGGSIIDAGAINNLADGTLTFAGDATVNADSDNVGDEIVTNAGTFIVNNTGGSIVAVGGDAFGGDAFTNSGTGTIAVNGLSTLSGITTLTNTSTSAAAINVAMGATLSATTLNSSEGTITVVGTLDAATTITGGTLTNEGTLTGVTTVNGGTLDVNSGMVGAVTVDDGTLDMDGGTVGAVANSGTTNIAAGTFASLTNNTGGDVDVTGGTVTGDVFNFGAFDANSGTFTVTSNNFTNEVGGTLTIDAGAIMTSDITNKNMMTLLGNVTRNVTNSRLLSVKGTTGLIGGNLTTTAGSTISMQDDGVATTQLNVTGDANLGGTILFDVDLRTGSTTGDTITVGGDLSGNVNLSFNNVAATAGSSGIIDLFNYENGSSSLSFSFLPSVGGLLTSGPFVYFVEDNQAGKKIELRSRVNSVVSNLAATVGLTQTIVGAIVNRPTSPFVSDFVGDKSEDVCGEGVWSRLTGGQADVEGTATDVTINQSTTAPVSLSYGGIQLGGDFACFGGHYNGWDMAFGGIAGFNQGSTSSNVFTVDANSGQTVVDSVTNTDIEQAYGGVYLTAAKGRLFSDLQYRYDNTEYTSNNIAVSGQGFDLNNAVYESKGHTVSGSVGYSWPIGTVEGLNFVSSVGLSLTNLSTDSVDLGTNGTLKINDSKSRIGFVSATIAKSKVLPDEISLLSYFGTLTYYNEFADDPTAVYTVANTQTNTQSRNLSMSNIGSYTELSAGVNHVRLLSPGDAGNARQLNTAVRVDARVGEDIESWGIAGQLRLQF